MTDRSKFEQMLEHLVNEDQEAAREIFHQIVVEKSREIYETILSEDFNEAKDQDEEMEEAKDEDEREVDEDRSETDIASSEDEMDENFAFDEADDDIGGDPTDDMLGDIKAGSDGMDGVDGMGDEGEGDLEDRVVDLEDALDDLRAEFEKIMGGEEGPESGMDSDMDLEPEGDGDDFDMGKGKEKDEMETFDANFMREYIEKVSSPKHGDNGANAKSIVAGKNDMGGTTANILNGGESTSGGTKGGLANPSTKEDNAGNVNVPGGKAGVKHLKKVSTPAGGDDGDKSAGSTLNGLKSRAK